MQLAAFDFPPSKTLL